MGLRFHRSFGSKYLRLNVSKTGLSMSAGVPGLHLNAPLVTTRKRKKMVTVGLPGSGISYRQSVGEGKVSREDNPVVRMIIGVIWVGIFVSAIVWFVH